MITEHDLAEAIAECQGERNPNANTCIKLAAFLTIRQHLFGDRTEESSQPYIIPSYSGDAGIIETTINSFSDTEFSRAIDGKNANMIWAIMDELMTVLQATNPRLYAGVMKKVEEG